MMKSYTIAEIFIPGSSLKKKKKVSLSTSGYICIFRLSKLGSWQSKSIDVLVSKYPKCCKRLKPPADQRKEGIDF